MWLIPGISLDGRGRNLNCCERPRLVWSAFHSLMRRRCCKSELCRSRMCTPRTHTQFMYSTCDGFPSVVTSVRIVAGSTATHAAKVLWIRDIRWCGAATCSAEVVSEKRVLHPVSPRRKGGGQACVTEKRVSETHVVDCTPRSYTFRIVNHGHALPWRLRNRGYGRGIHRGAW